MLNQTPKTLTIMNVKCMSRTTGKALTEDKHVLQSLKDIVTTPIGSRVMRRDYGSLVPFLIDQPASPRLVMQLRAAIIHAIMRWEKRVKPTAINIIPSMDGKATLQIDYELVTTKTNHRDFLSLGASL